MTEPSELQSPAYHVVMVSFDGVDTAGRALTRVKGEHGFDDCEIEAEALISRDPDGQVHVHEKGATGVGATFGAVTAGLISLVGGPIFLPVMIVAGAVAGGVVGHFAGQVLPPEDLKKVAESLTPGSSAYVAVVDSSHADIVASAFEPEGTVAVNSEVETEISSMIREGIIHSIRRV
jgi:uncharacterized membrane protein